jgi:hypothetical protein
VNLLNSIPLASVLTVLYALGGAYCLVTGQINFEEFGIAMGAAGAGNAALGHVRNQAGKGTHGQAPV